MLNVPFWNAHLLAREAATADRLTGGRLELGLGAGHMKWEFDEAGLPWEAFGARAHRLEETIGELGRLFAADGYEQRAAIDEHHGLDPLKPVQHTGFGGSGPPLLVGGPEEQIADQIRASRERFGFTNFTVHAPFMDVLGPVLERLR